MFKGKEQQNTEMANINQKKTNAALLPVNKIGFMGK